MFILGKKVIPVLIAGAMGVLHASAALSHEFKAGDLTVLHPVVRATPGGAKVGGGYLVIRNSGSSPDRLVSIESPAAESIRVHSMRQEGDVVRMSERKGGVSIPAQGEVRFASVGDHVMFQGLKAPFKIGEIVPGVLIFERAGRVSINFGVEPMGGAMQRHKAH